jgi:hypothetical protein
VTYSAVTGPASDAWQKGVLDPAAAMDASGEFAAAARNGDGCGRCWSRDMARLRADASVRAKVKRIRRSGRWPHLAGAARDSIAEMLK